MGGSRRQEEEVGTKPRVPLYMESWSCSPGSCHRPWHSIAAPPCSHSSALPLSFTKPSTSGPEPPLQPPTQTTGICLSRQDPNTFAICFKTDARLSLCQAPKSRLEDHKPFRLMKLPLYPVSSRESWRQTM